MQLPFFFAGNLDESGPVVELDEDNSRHAIQVLRMKKGDHLHLTDGKGNLHTAAIVSDHKKHCQVSISSTLVQPAPNRHISIAISLLKNGSRFEWFLEKATELGISEIIPLICERTERQKFRFDRMQGICISALLQSRQSWLPHLHEPTVFETMLKASGEKKATQQFIAHCVDDEQKKSLSSYQFGSSVQLLIGPEGDFSSAEIQLAEGFGFLPVSLGNNRLRTETAGVVAASLLALS